MGQKGFEKLAGGVCDDEAKNVFASIGIIESEASVGPNRASGLQASADGELTRLGSTKCCDLTDPLTLKKTCYKAEYNHRKQRPKKAVD